MGVFTHVRHSILEALRPVPAPSFAPTANLIHQAREAQNQAGQRTPHRAQRPQNLMPGRLHDWVRRAMCGRMVRTMAN